MMISYVFFLNKLPLDNLTIGMFIFFIILNISRKINDIFRNNLVRVFGNEMYVIIVLPLLYIIYLFNTEYSLQINLLFNLLKLLVDIIFIILVKKFGPKDLKIIERLVGRDQ